MYEKITRLCKTGKLRLSIKQDFDGWITMKEDTPNTVGKTMMIEVPHSDYECPRPTDGKKKKSKSRIPNLHKVIISEEPHN